MSSARENILNRIGKTLKSGRTKDWQLIPESRMQTPPRLIRPLLPDNLLTCFIEKLHLGGGSFAQIDNINQLETEIERYLADHKLPYRLRLAPSLQSLKMIRLDISYGKSDGHDLVSLTPAFCGIAETGSVVLLSGSNDPTSLNFLPDVHIVLLKQQQLVAHMESAWEKIRSEGLNTDGTVPRSINLITGPSKTADIEQTLQIGAHGPRSLHVIFLTALSEKQTSIKTPDA